MEPIAPGASAHCGVGFDLKHVIRVHFQVVDDHVCFAGVGVLDVDGVHPLVVGDLVEDDFSVPLVLGRHVPCQLHACRAQTQCREILRGTARDWKGE